MIFWDLSAHLINLLGLRKKFLESKSILSYYYPHTRYKKTATGPVERTNSQKKYDYFWTLYWGIAFVLLLIYILFR